MHEHSTSAILICFHGWSTALPTMQCTVSHVACLVQIVITEKLFKLLLTEGSHSGLTSWCGPKTMQSQITICLLLVAGSARRKQLRSLQHMSCTYLIRSARKSLHKTDRIFWFVSVVKVTSV